MDIYKWIFVFLELREISRELNFMVLKVVYYCCLQTLIKLSNFFNNT